MPADTEPCPGEPELRAFHHGDCEEEALDRVAGHLELCPLCSERLARIEAEADPIFDALRHRPRAEAPRTLGPAAEPRPARPFTAPPGYESLDWLGSGGMSEVYRARHSRLGRVVALKRLKTDSLFDLDRFRREARVVAALQHPNVIQIYEFGDNNGQPFLALEYADSGSLAEYLKTCRIPPRQAAALVGLLARAVEHAHHRGVVHRDLKPANILLVSTGKATGDILSGYIPKIADFGIARRIEGAGEIPEAGVTRTGSILGTPSYMAPEQAAGKKVGPAADIHALGAILYELLVERPPFQGEETFETLRQVIDEDPVPPARLRPGLPRDLETICLKCLRKDPARRYASAAELEADLNRFLDGRPIEARPTSSFEQAWKWARRHPAVASSIAVAQVALIVLAVGVSWSNERIRRALDSTRAAERQAEQNAQVALQAHQQLVGRVQTLLREDPATRPLRAALLETAVSGLQGITATNATTPQVSRALAHQLLGEVHWELGHANEAIEESGRCLQVVNALLSSKALTSEAWRIRATAARRLGTFYLQQDKADIGRRYMEQAVAATDDWLAAEPGNREARSVLIDALVHAGHAAHWIRNFPAARQDLARANTLCEAWLAEEPDSDEARERLSGVLDLLATLHDSEGDHRAALALQRRAMKVVLDLEARAKARHDAEPGKPGNRPNAQVRSVMITQVNLATSYTRFGDLAAARPLMDGAIERGRWLAASDPENLQRQLDLVDAIYTRGEIEEYGLLHTNALPFLDECHSLLEQLHSRGKLAGRPIYEIERREAVDRERRLCRTLPAALADDAVIWSAPGDLIPELARVKIAVLLRDHRLKEARTTARRLLGYEPKDSDPCLDLARAYSQAADHFAQSSKDGTAAEMAQSLLDRGIQALRRWIVGRKGDPGNGWLTDEQLAALHRHPEFAKLSTISDEGSKMKPQ